MDGMGVCVWWLSGHLSISLEAVSSSNARAIFQLYAIGPLIEFALNPKSSKNIVEQCHDKKIDYSNFFDFG
jgi:hypothetical protein